MPKLILWVACHLLIGSSSNFFEFLGLRLNQPNEIHEIRKIFLEWQIVFPWSNYTRVLALEAEQPLVGEVDERLVVEDELVAVQRQAM